MRRSSAGPASPPIDTTSLAPPPGQVTRAPSLAGAPIELPLLELGESQGDGLVRSLGNSHNACRDQRGRVGAGGLRHRERRVGVVRPGHGVAPSRWAGRIAAGSWLSGGVGGLVAAAESLDRCCRGRAEASDGRFLLGQVGQEIGRITLAMPVGQMMGNQQGQGRVVGGRTTWPSDGRAHKVGERPATCVSAPHRNPTSPGGDDVPHRFPTYKTAFPGTRRHTC